MNHKLDFYMNVAQKYEHEFLSSQISYIFIDAHTTSADHLDTVRYVLHLQKIFETAKWRVLTVTSCPKKETQVVITDGVTNTRLDVIRLVDACDSFRDTGEDLRSVENFRYS